uniref:Uncharacterized protein n=1 Tax=Amphimedon queenslandica TaxID=400682 RepID=A0A1X7TAE5_AMPQE
MLQQSKSRIDDHHTERDSASKNKENKSKVSVESSAESIVKSAGPKNNSWDKSLINGRNIQLQGTVKPNDDSVILQSDGFQGRDRNDRDADEEQVSDNMMLFINENYTIPFVAYEEDWINYEEMSSSSTLSLINYEAPMMDDYLTDSETAKEYSRGIIVIGLFKLVSNSIL